jgi:iron(III) transport system permease protein
MKDVGAMTSTRLPERDSSLLGSLVVALIVAAAVYLVLGPLSMLLAAALRGPQDLLPFEPGARWTIANLRDIYLDRSLYASIVPNTLAFTAGSVALTSVLAFALAWLVERTDLPWRNAVYAIVVCPLVVPGVVLAIVWIFLLAPNTGWINVALRALLRRDGSGPFDIFSLGGMILSQGIGLVPFMFLLLTATLRSMNPSLEEAGITAGATPWVTIRRVTLPALRPGLLAALILVTLVTLEQFETPLLIGLPARVNVFSTRIYFELNPDSNLPAYGRAAAVALPFLAAGILMLMLYNQLVRRADRYVTVTGKAFRPARFALGRWRGAAIAFVIFYVAVAAALPAFVLVWASLFGYGVPSLAELRAPSLAGYADLLAGGKLANAIRNTLLVAAGSAAIVTSIGAVVAWIVARSRMPGRRALDFISFMSLGIPSVIAALAAMLLYLTLPLGLYGTVWMLLLAYSYRLAVSTRLARASLMQLHPELEEAARMSGALWPTTLRRIVLPLMTPSLTASFVLLFLIGFREFTIPSILQSPDNTVLSVLMWQFFLEAKTEQAAAVGTVIVLLVVPVVFVLRRVALRR